LVSYKIPGFFLQIFAEKKKRGAQEYVKSTKTMSLANTLAAVQVG
jgi:hypothetical protein